jgi:RNA polymerase subunit RPABC4/transcription elongation factor Spt4
MVTRNQSSTRFKDEIRIISPWAFFIAALVLLAMVALLVLMMGKDPKAPSTWLRALMGVVGGALLGCYVVLIGYVNRDAGRRRMSRLLWTLIAIFVPNGLGIVLYFVLRKPRATNCSQCGAEIEPGFSFCPRCRNRLQPVCPHCQRSVNPGDKFCPYCGGDVESNPGVAPNAATSLS